MHRYPILSSLFPDMRFLRRFATLALGLVVRAQAAWEGRVVGVPDGDTVTVLHELRAPHKIRLVGIDAPEKAQPWGQRAKASLSSLVHATHPGCRQCGDALGPGGLQEGVVDRAPVRASPPSDERA